MGRIELAWPYNQLDPRNCALMEAIFRGGGLGWAPGGSRPSAGSAFAKGQVEKGAAVAKTVKEAREERELRRKGPKGDGGGGKTGRNNGGGVFARPPPPRLARPL
eukprot:330479-Pyramimonas_sp.AAC.1